MRSAHPVCRFFAASLQIFVADSHVTVPCARTSFASFFPPRPPQRTALAGATHALRHRWRQVRGGFCAAGAL